LLSQLPRGVCQMVAKEDIISSTSLDMMSPNSVFRPRKASQSGNTSCETLLAADDPLPLYPGLVKVFSVRRRRRWCIPPSVIGGRERSLTNWTYRVTDSTVDLKIPHQESRCGSLVVGTTRRNLDFGGLTPALQHTQLWSIRVLMGRLAVTTCMIV